MKDSVEQIRSILAREGITITGAMQVRDQDGTLIQLGQSADINLWTLRQTKTAVVPGLIPVFRPQGLDQVTITVENLDKSAELYRKLCGPEMQRTNGQLVFKIGLGTLVVREASRGERPGINYFRVLVDRYDHAEAAS